jgi:hydrophobic/amphiphilic exporter-1 (mainly G- bacteria), HAE1 family
LQEKLTPLKFEDELNEEVAAELEQYANAAHQQKGIEKK